MHNQADDVIIITLISLPQPTANIIIYTVNYTALFALHASAAAVASVDYAILNFCAMEGLSELHRQREEKSEGNKPVWNKPVWNTSRNTHCLSLYPHPLFFF